MSASFKIENGKKVFVDAQTVHCVCPTGCGGFNYRTRISAEDVQFRCAHCGKQVVTKQVKYVS